MVRAGLLLVGSVLATVLLVIWAWAALNSPVSLRIAVDSEHEPLAPILTDWAKDNGVDLTLQFDGAVALASQMDEDSALEADAVWLAHSMWLDMGKGRDRFDNSVSVYRSPVVLALRAEAARDLGWTDTSDVTMAMIADAVQSSAVRLGLSSATESHVGAAAFLGLAQGISTPDHEDLTDSQMRDNVHRMLRRIDHSAGTSLWLTQGYLSDPGGIDGFFAFEEAVVAANRTLQAVGQAPLVIVHPADAPAMADHPFALAQGTSWRKQRSLTRLKEHLLSPEVQRDLAYTGTDAVQPGYLPLPEPRTVRAALELYQSELRRPSLTVWLLDVSGSMQGDPIQELRGAMLRLMAPEDRSLRRLNPSAQDITIVMPFRQRPDAASVVAGHDDDALNDAVHRLKFLQAGGSANLYLALCRALDAMRPYTMQGEIEEFMASIVVLTDGASDTQKRAQFFSDYRASGLSGQVPVHTIALAGADHAQLSELSHATGGQVFQVDGDLYRALRRAGAYH